MINTFKDYQKLIIDDNFKHLDEFRRYIPNSLSDHQRVQLLSVTEEEETPWQLAPRRGEYDTDYRFKLSLTPKIGQIHRRW